MLRSSKTCQIFRTLVLPGLLLSVVGGISLNVEAHPAILKQIRDVSRQILAERYNSQLYLQRAGLYVEHHDWQKALADIDTVEALAGESPTTDYLRAQIAFTQENYASALLAAEKTLQKDTHHQPALLLQARSLAAVNRLSEAAASFERCIAMADRPDPQWYVERARVRTLEKPVPAGVALAELQSGINKLGPLIVLKMEVIHLHLLNADTTSALQEIDQLIADSPRPEHWLYQKGRILQEAGQLRAAQQLYKQTLHKIASLPARHRRTLAMSRLKGQCQGALSRMQKAALQKVHN